MDSDTDRRRFRLGGAAAGALDRRYRGAPASGTRLAHAKRDLYRVGVTDCDANSDQHRDPNGHANRNRYTYGDQHRNSNAYFYQYRDGHRCADRNRDVNGDQHRDPNIDRYLH